MSVVWFLTCLRQIQEIASFENKIMWMNCMPQFLNLLWPLILPRTLLPKPLCLLPFHFFIHWIRFKYSCVLGACPRCESSVYLLCLYSQNASNFGRGRTCFRSETDYLNASRNERILATNLFESNGQTQISTTKGERIKFFAAKWVPPSAETEIYTICI